MHSISSTGVLTDIRKKIQNLSLAALLAITSVGAAIAPLFLYQIADAAATNQTVQESNIARQTEDTTPSKPWVIYTRVTTPGTAAFRSGPTAPPQGVGSLEFGTTAGTDKVYAFNYEHKGTKLSDINALGYSTYRSTGLLQQDTALNMEVDFNGPAVAGGFTTLVFEPVYNTAQGPVTSNQWQTWDAFSAGNARWWSTKDIGGTCAFTCYSKWSDIVAANPNATILGGYGLNQGSGNPNLTVASDALIFGAGKDKVTYNFEPTLTPTKRDDCKKDGWKQYNAPSFKNQGQCVNYVEDNSREIDGDIRYNAGGLNREAWFNMNTADDNGWFVYSDADHDWYGVRVTDVKVDGNTGWYAGQVDRSRGNKFNGNWVLVKVVDGKPDQISGSFTTEALAKAGVASKQDPADGPFNVQHGNIKIKKD